MGECYVISNGGRCCYIEFETVRTGAISTSQNWRQRPPFNKSLLENIIGTWASIAPVSSTYGGARIPGGGSMTATVFLEDQNHRQIMQLDRLPAVGETASGVIIRPDGWRDKIVIARMAPRVDPAKAWIGAGLKGGVTVVAGGKEALVGSLWNLHSADLGFPFVATASRVGLGAGASGGVVLCLGYGFDSPQGALGIGLGGWDFNLSLGARWSAWLKSLRLANPKTAGALAKLIRALTQVRTSQIKSLDSLMQLTSGFVHNEGMINLFKNLVGLSNFDDRTKCLITFDLPASGGLEVSIVYTDGSVVAVDGPSAAKYIGSLQLESYQPREPRYGSGNRPAY
ncbi:hypothetical protein [Vineibacter terrae]|uniref:hypothetical protein n=1 Tax=Vineibacter terrae TaxID=2586908 RepID=UPI002E2F407B|nr:hypothetical protein [Vineibacter terrae]HEX2891121.1 hypothetical protein [Vineibacter terrae]